jgi:Tol biopolymer transport system component
MAGAADGKYLVFVGQRNGDYDIYKVPSTGGEEVNLTNSKGLDDGCEYSPDGKYIYFNSVRNGLMQIYRMKPDGSNVEQLTNDQLNNWFAHPSPDGKWIVFHFFSDRMLVLPIILFINMFTYALCPQTAAHQRL